MRPRLDSATILLLCGCSATVRWLPYGRYFRVLEARIPMEAQLVSPVSPPGHRGSTALRPEAFPAARPSFKTHGPAANSPPAADCRLAGSSSARASPMFWTVSLGRPSPVDPRPRGAFARDLRHFGRSSGSPPRGRGPIPSACLPYVKKPGFPRLLPNAVTRLSFPMTPPIRRPSSTLSTRSPCGSSASAPCRLRRVGCWASALVGRPRLIREGELHAFVDPRHAGCQAA